MKQLKYGLVSLLAVILIMLTGCSKDTISNVKSSYQPEAMATIIKGRTNADKLKYKLADGDWQKAKVNSGAFIISVSRNNQTQTVQLKAGAVTKKTVVKKATPIMALSKFVMTYEFATQQNPTALKLNDTLTTTKNLNGVIAKNDNGQIRAIITNQQLMGLTLIAKNSNLKMTKGLNEFGSTLGTLAGVTGADAKKVLKQFAKKTKDVKNGKTTIDTIESKGIKFDVAFSNKNIYVYVTH